MISILWERSVVLRRGMESLGFMDDLMDFSLDMAEEDDNEEKPGKLSQPPSNSDPTSYTVPGPEDPSRLMPESAEEEELEWLSNKDAFPSIESCVDILCDQLSTKAKHENSDSLLKYSNSNAQTTDRVKSSLLMSCFANMKVPVRARSKHRRKRHQRLADISSHQFWHIQPNSNVTKVEPLVKHSTIGRKCQHCGAEKTPQWRAGPGGPKTLCNACGVRYKSGRLVPEYRPASSPTFRSDLHSNLHRKVIEMRKQKELGMVVHDVDNG